MSTADRKWPAFLDPRLIVVILALFFAGITAHRVFTAPLWGDELRTWRDGIEKPLADVLLWRHNPDHAPLGHLLARAGAYTFGVERPWSLRLGGWLIGLACVAAVWRLGRSVGDRSTGNAIGLLMAAMLVVDPNVGFQITQARMYAPLLLACTIALAAAITLLAKDDGFDGSRGTISKSRVAVLALALAVGLWSHSQVYAVLVPMLLVGIGTAIARGRQTRRVDRRAFAVLTAIGIALVLGAQGVLKLIGRRDADSVGDIETGEAPLEQLEDATIALTGENWVTAFIAVAAIAGLVVIGRRNRAAAWLLGGVIAMAIVDLLIAARYRPVAFARYLTVMQPALWAAIAAFIVELWQLIGRQPWRRPAVVGTRSAIAVGFVALCGFQLSRTIELMPAHPVAAPFREAMRTVRNEDAPCLVLPRSPYGMYARFYGVTNDGVKAEEAAKLITRRGRQAATRESAVTDPLFPITIVGVVPARGAKANTADDPITLARGIARARGIEPPDVPTPDGTLRVVIIRFAAGGVSVDDPRRPVP